MPFALVVLLAGLVIAWLVGEPFWAERRRRKLADRPFPPAWARILDRRVPYVLRLPPHARRELERHIQVFVSEKAFVGCAGQEITDEVRVTIAAQACLLLLNRRAGHFPNLRQILVYPGAFVVERFHPVILGVPGTGTAIGGPVVLQSHEPRVLSGESWTHGQVVLSWENVLEGAADPDDGRNVVIHEFAHQLDQEKGYANGAPWLGRRDRYPRWSRTMGEEYARLQYRTAVGEPSLFSAYAATSPAEFFAVFSEVFFEQPREMARLHPALYEELALLYRVSPRDWTA
jgi:Mlc titration factor MtfA (ptsG expression regulator)